MTFFLILWNNFLIKKLNNNNIMCGVFILDKVFWDKLVCVQVITNCQFSVGQMCAGEECFPAKFARLPSFTTLIKVSSHTLHTLPQSFNLFKASLVLNRHSCIENNLATQLSIVFRFDHFESPTFWSFYVCIDGSRSVPVFIFPLRKLGTFALFESPTFFF